MTGKDRVMAEAYPCSVDPYLIFEGGNIMPKVSTRLLGIAADAYAYLLYRHLQPKLGLLPDWFALVDRPETLPRVSIATRTQGERSWQVTILPFDGGELELSRPWPNPAFTFYSFDLDYQTGMQLLAGFDPKWLARLVFWFACDRPRLEMTLAEYLKAVAALTAQEGGRCTDAM